MSNSLITKYNVAGPRYTSYPTVPYWDAATFNYDKWVQSFQRSFDESNTTEGISLYIHLPFCESLCTFCGCHKRITKRHEVEKPYIEAVLKEWKLYAAQFSGTPKIKEIHLGGGTPTFFSSENLERLINGIFTYAERCDDTAFSFEGHPNNTTEAHLRALYNVGFTRVSFGVQDYAPKVQKAINRIQPYKNVQKVTQLARKIGFTSVGHDLVYGLPFQTLDDVLQTIEYTKALKPDRIAFYSYAHVPWIKGNGQRGFKDEDLPSGPEKQALYEQGKAALLNMGYVDVGMDHFTLLGDSMYTAMQEGSLHRNFMGYTASKTHLMIGLGVSSISDSWYGFAQNVKDIDEYYTLLEANTIPVYRGHILHQEDLTIRKHILNLMCTFKTSWNTLDTKFSKLPEVIIALQEMENDALLYFEDNALFVTEKGKPFIRNICMAFDLRLQEHKPETKIFSMTI